MCRDFFNYGRTFWKKAPHTSVPMAWWRELIKPRVAATHACAGGGVGQRPPARGGVVPWTGSRQRYRGTQLKTA